MTMLDTFTVEELARRHADAVTAMQDAHKAFAAAALKAEQGDASDLSAARAALQRAQQRECDLAAAVQDANAVAAATADGARQAEQERRWALAAKHLQDRARHAADLADALALAAKAWKALVASSDAAARCAPQALDPALSMVAPSALISAAGLEMKRLGLPLRAEAWPFAPNPIPVLAESIVAANTFALRPALRGPRVQPTINQPEKSHV